MNKLELIVTYIAGVVSGVLVTRFFYTKAMDLVAILLAAGAVLLLFWILKLKLKH